MYGGGGYEATDSQNGETRKHWRVCFSQCGAMGLGSHVVLCVPSCLVSCSFGKRRLSLPCIMGKGFLFVECFVVYP